MRPRFLSDFVAAGVLVAQTSAAGGLLVNQHSQTNEDQGWVKWVFGIGVLAIRAYANANNASSSAQRVTDCTSAGEPDSRCPESRLVHPHSRFHMFWTGLALCSSFLCCLLVCVAMHKRELCATDRICQNP